MYFLHLDVGLYGSATLLRHRLDNHEYWVGGELLHLLVDLDVILERRYT